MTAAVALPGLVVRPGCDDDVRFVSSSWVNAVARPRSSWERAGISQAQLLGAYRDVVPPWVDRHVSALHVLCFPDAPSEILAWMAVEGRRLHFLYTKGPYRLQGFAARLLATAPLVDSVTCNTADWKRFALARGLALRFDPFPFLKGLA